MTSISSSYAYSDGAIRNRPNAFSIVANRSDDDGGSSDEDSVHELNGCWEGDRAQWRGCICEEIHPRPHKVFWIQCDGPCQSWYNVSAECVGLDEMQAESLPSWLCLKCEKKLPTTSPFGLLLSFPDVLMYHILKFCARPSDRALVLSRQIAPLCSVTRHAVRNKWNGLWDLLLQEEYGKNKSLGWKSTSLKQRSSKRRRRIMLDAREKIIETHVSWCAQMDDAHMALTTMAESQQCPLSLKRLRSILMDRGSIRINRRSQCGRTLLQACCAADFVDEGVVLRCIKELVEIHGADPNVFTNAEYPNADRPALFFAIARVMPSVVDYLIQRGGASLDVKVTGRFRLVSDPSEHFHGTCCTPLGFARKIKVAEADFSASSSLNKMKHLPSYWASKLNTCIRILSKAEDGLK